MIRTATGDDFETLTGVLVRAFADDPLANWLVRPEADRREDGFSRLFRETVRFGLHAGEVLTTDSSEGAAIWFAPGRYRMGLGGLVRLVPQVARAFGPWAMLPKILAVNEVGKRHPKAPHWYLFSFGVDPEHQRKGVGGALLRHALHKVDAEHAPAYLETALESNLALYHRFGFSTVEKVQVPRGGPPVWRMWREAR
jgi:ribosomal protein S18 acetylase RimI-like enzyme